MDFAQPVPQPVPGPADPAQQRTERHLRMLAELGELGMDLARALHRRAMSETAEVPSGPQSNPPADPALQFARVARAVRQTVALEARLAEDRATQQERRQAAQARQAAEAARDAAAQRKTRIRRHLLPALEAHRDAGRLLGDLEEWLDDDAEDPHQLPLAEAVARICRDLGIARGRIPALAGADWTRPDHTAAPDNGAAIEDAVMPPTAPKPQGAWAPLRPASISPHLVDLPAPRGAVSGAGPP